MGTSGAACALAVTANVVEVSDRSPGTYIVRLWRQSDAAPLAGQVEASGGALSARFASPSELAAILHAPSIHLRPRAIPQPPPAAVIKLYRQGAARG